MSETTCGLPSGGSQLSHSGDGPIAEFGEDIAQVLAKLDVQATAGFDDGDDGGDLWSGTFIAQVEPVPPAKGYGAHRALAPIIVDLYLAVGEVLFNPAPLSKGVVTGFGQSVNRWTVLADCQAVQGVTIAPAPAQILPRSKLSDQLIIEVLAAKFQQHNPVYRQCASLLEDHGIDLSRQTLNDGILAAAQLLVPVVKAQAAELLSGHYLQADETTIPCQTPEKKGKNHTAYLWEYSRAGGAVVFDFQMGRGRKTGPGEFLKPFRGKLQCDGYAAYDKLGEGITFVACMAHIRREFADVSKLKPLDPLPVEILAQIGLLYDVERKARAQNLTPTQRLDLRQAKSEPVMTALKARIIQMGTELFTLDDPDKELSGLATQFLADLVADERTGLAAGAAGTIAGMTGNDLLSPFQMGGLCLGNGFHLLLLLRYLGFALDLGSGDNQFLGKECELVFRELVGLGTPLPDIPHFELLFS